MRLIWSTDKVDDLDKFCRILTAKNIDYLQEEYKEQDWSHHKFGDKTRNLWIYDEDQAIKAEELLKAFLENPASIPITESFVQPAESPKTPLPKQMSEKQDEEERPRAYLTNFLIALCSTILLMQIWQAPPRTQTPAHTVARLASSPIEKELLYDYPESFELIDKIIVLYGPESLNNPDTLPAAGKIIYDTYQHTPYWHGYYPYLVAKSKNLFGKPVTLDVTASKAPQFEKISQGEIWRLVTPIILHGDILHLFFNMIWLLILGTQIETRIGSFKYLLLIIVGAIIPNTMQYLVSGPAFIGFSGVVCTMAFFIRERQKIAPWEGYAMTRATFHFIVFFIGALALFSSISFILDAFALANFPIAIANSAHIVGAIVGYFLGKSTLFSWDVR